MHAHVVPKQDISDCQTGYKLLLADHFKYLSVVPDKDYTVYLRNILFESSHIFHHKSDMDNSRIRVSIDVSDFDTIHLYQK